jgi:hypothetical protein
MGGVRGDEENGIKLSLSLSSAWSPFPFLGTIHQIQKITLRKKDKKFSTSGQAETINAWGYLRLCSPRAQHATILVAELAL